MDQRETLPRWGGKPVEHFHMVDVTSKSPTLRRAEARGTIRMSAHAFQLVKDRKLPKGDALTLCEVSGILAAKQTANLLPLCHPLPIEEVKVHCLLEEKTCSVHVACQVSTTAKTGVEMEALMGTNAALLCLYDLIKMVDPALLLENIRLNYKEGGKSGLWKHPLATEEQLPPKQVITDYFCGLKCAVLTASDRVSKNLADDFSGPAAKTWLKERGANVVELRVVPDEKIEIQDVLRSFTRMRIPLVILTGGTGMGPRDVTISAITEMGAKEMKGFGELCRQEGAKVKKSAWLSNSGGFIFENTLFIALPGSPKAVEEGLSTLKELLPHALHILTGGNHG